MEHQQVYNIETHADALDALVQLCSWLRAPSRSVMLARFNAETLLRDWLPGGLVRDSLKVIASIETRDLHKLRLIRYEPEPDGVVATEMPDCE